MRIPVQYGSFVFVLIIWLMTSVEVVSFSEYQLYSLIYITIEKKYTSVVI